MPTADRRLWSLTMRGLSEMIGDFLQIGISASDVHTLARRFRELDVYPARDFESRCAPRPPDIFITYDWRYNFVDLQVAAYEGLLYIRDELSAHQPSVDAINFEALLFDELTFWIDFVFINQSARDVRAELDVMPDLIDSSKLHFALSHTALTRAWCCYELALFNKRFLEPKPETRPPPAPLLGSLLAPMPLGYRGWADAESSVAQDKVFLEEQLNDLYPRGTLGVDALMIQASLVGEHIYTYANSVQTGLAVEQALTVGDGWLRDKGWIPG
ncbi:MAG TPA: hypothetical protein VFP31_01550 [Gaiellaceae bacterium]|nr:hypothetical protein [Gaiellaceae bacterium]